jgi:hypothetical protein
MKSGLEANPAKKAIASHNKALFLPEIRANKKLAIDN